MSAFYVARIKVKDGEKLQDYSAQALPIFASYGGKLVTKGDLKFSTDSSSEHDFAVVMQFSNLEMLNKALNSDSYQNILPIRHAAAEVNISVYQ
jgi:uncharacterized protein (DUF1330 family)